MTDPKFWSPDEIEFLKISWLEGKSGGYVAKVLQRTRNAVMGRINRMGLMGKQPGAALRVRVKAKAKTRRRQRAVLIADANVPPTVPELPSEPPAPQNIIPFADLTRHTCRWPFGDPRLSDFGFCGQPVMELLPYCAAHAQIAYNYTPYRGQHVPFRKPRPR